MIKKIICIFVIVFCLFAISLLRHTNNVGGDIVSTRRFGWPSHSVWISKITDNQSDAQRIKSESTISLLNNGWKIDYDAFGLFCNFIVFLVISSLLIAGFSALKRQNSHNKR